MKILFSADTHIKLGQKNVPSAWQENRFLMLGERLDNIFGATGCDLHIIGGDLMDVADPSSEEVELMFAFLAKLGHPGIIYTGNHELKTKTISCLDHYAADIHDATNGLWKVVKDYRSPEFDIIPYSSLHKASWKPRVSDICFTHVRGAIPPHVVPEIDLERFVEHGYSKVFAGDLHSYKNSQKIGDVDLLYPGSPLTTSFHRERTKGTNGAFIIDTVLPRDHEHYLSWVELGDLPQLIRKTIEVGEPMEADAYDRVIYEVTGDVSQLKTLKNSELLDKKINNRVTKDAKLDLDDMSLLQELDTYFTNVQKLDEVSRTRILKRAAEYVDSN